MIEPEIDAADVAALAADLIAAPSPNPPGDVTMAARVVIDHLLRHDIAYRIIRTATGMWNIVSTIEGAHDGPHVMLSGHLDTFPFTETPRSRRGPSRHRPSTDRVFGRGAVDMKGGVAALLSAYTAIAAQRSGLRGRLSVCLVCDEETFGPHGARAVIRRWPYFKSDFVLSGEPSGRGVIRHGERGFVWGKVRFDGTRGHAAYGMPDDNPIVRAGRFLDALAGWVAGLVPRSGEGGTGTEPPPHARPTLNVGTIRGGEKINLQPAFCEVEVDLRVPFGMTALPLVAPLTETAAAFGGVYRTSHVYDPSESDPDGPLFRIMASAVRDTLGVEPEFTLGLGATDGRLWRGLGVPVAAYGSDPTAQGRDDESVPVAELGEMARVHAITAVRLMSGATAPQGER